MADPADYARRLIRKALARRLRVLVCATAEDVARVSSALWAEPVGFLPHALQDSLEHVRQRSPVFLCSDFLANQKADVLINLRPEVPPHMDNFGRLIEIVSQDEGQRAKARQRWRHFTALGWVPEGFDAAA